MSNMFCLQFWCEASGGQIINREQLSLRSLNNVPWSSRYLFTHLSMSPFVHHQDIPVVVGSTTQIKYIHQENIDLHSFIKEWYPKPFELLADNVLIPERKGFSSSTGLLLLKQSRKQNQHGTTHHTLCLMFVHGYFVKVIASLYLQILI